MTWHLKDRELEKKLTELCSDFLETLNYGVYSKRDDENYIFVSFDRDKSGNSLGSNNLWFWIDELEEVHEYNPHAWNEYPKVMPPEYVWMRLEICPDSPVASRVCAKFKNGEWFLDDGTVENFGDYSARFRPWED